MIHYPLLLGSVTNMMGLVTFVNQLRQIHRGEYQVSILQNRAMSQICRLQGHSIPDEFVVAPANSPGVLLNWRILLVLFVCLSDRDRQGVIVQYPVSASWIDVEGLPEEMDSHFHLDRTRKALNSQTHLLRTSAPASVQIGTSASDSLVESLFSVIRPHTLPGKRCRNSGTKVSPSPLGYIRNMWIPMPRQILQPSSSDCRALRSACWGKYDWTIPPTHLGGACNTWFWTECQSTSNPRMFWNEEHHRTRVFPAAVSSEGCHPVIPADPRALFGRWPRIDGQVAE